LKRHIPLAAPVLLVFLARALSGDPLSAGLPAATSAAETLLLPGVANTVGTHGVRWKSDVALKNPGNDPIEVRLVFLRSGQANDLGSAPHKDLFLISNETRDLRNVLASELGVAGNGALLVSASRAIFPNNPPGATVAATMRTATPVLLGPGDAGSAVLPAEPTDAANQLVSGVKHDGVGEKGFRGSVGAVNLSKTQGLTLRIEYLETSGEILASKTLHLPPLSTAQQPVPVRLSGGSARFVRIDGAGSYVAYATTVDNATSEASFTYAVPEPGRPSAPHTLSYGSLAE
jgi:hypothetical protein